MFKFKGCGTSTKSGMPSCGTLGVYCSTCLTARVTHLEQRLVSILASNYETPNLSVTDIENNLKAVAQNWSIK